jgi:hypothetical protein
MKEKKKSSLVTTREWAAFVLSTLAIVISITTAYLTTLRTLDELKVVVDRRPVLFLWSDGKSMMTYGVLSVLFINSGNRPISVLSVSLCYGEAKEVRGRTTCNGVLIDTNFDGVVIDEKKVLLKEISLRLRVLFFEGDNLSKEDSAFTFNAAKALERGVISMCAVFRVATPSNEATEITVELERRRVSAVGPHESLLSTTQPVLIWRESGTVFSSR